MTLTEIEYGFSLVVVGLSESCSEDFHIYILCLTNTWRRGPPINQSRSRVPIPTLRIQVEASNVSQITSQSNWRVAYGTLADL